MIDEKFKEKAVQAFVNIKTENMFLDFVSKTRFNNRLKLRIYEGFEFSLFLDGIDIYSDYDKNDCEFLRDAVVSKRIFENFVFKFLKNGDS